MSVGFFLCFFDGPLVYIEKFLEHLDIADGVIHDGLFPGCRVPNEKGAVKLHPLAGDDARQAARREAARERDLPRFLRGRAEPTAPVERRRQPHHARSGDHRQHAHGALRR